jgi:3,4-dihydroxy 2-butanone 4-phosphate synthase/GTP cyclohydrolase II
VPLRAKEGGVLCRPGHTEAAVDLARMAGLRPAGVICGIVSRSDEGAMAKTDELRAFADEHNLALVSIADLITWRCKHEKHVNRIAEARVPTDRGVFTAVGYTSIYNDDEHVALVRGDIAGPDGDGSGVLVHVHSECLAGDTYRSGLCDCRPELDATLDMITSEGRGVVLYMRRGHERRGRGCYTHDRRADFRTITLATMTSECSPTQVITASTRIYSPIWVSPRCCQQNAPLLSTTSGLAV